MEGSPQQINQLLLARKLTKYIYIKKATLGLDKERLVGKAKSSRRPSLLECERSYILDKLSSMFWGLLYIIASL